MEQQRSWNLPFAVSIRYVLSSSRACDPPAAVHIFLPLSFSCYSRPLVPLFSSPQVFHVDRVLRYVRFCFVNIFPKKTREEAYSFGFDQTGLLQRREIFEVAAMTRNVATSLYQVGPTRKRLCSYSRPIKASRKLNVMHYPPNLLARRPSTTFSRCSVSLLNRNHCEQDSIRIDTVRPMERGTSCTFVYSTTTPPSLAFPSWSLEIYLRTTRRKYSFCPSRGFPWL